MGFILRASFWFGVVLLYLPGHAENIAVQKEMIQNQARNLVQIADTAAMFCVDQPAFCKTASSTGKLASAYVTTAANEIGKKPPNETP